MDFRAQYLQAMRDQDPAEFKRLSRNGMLEPQSRAVAKQASRMKEDLLKDAPRDKHGQVESASGEGSGGAGAGGPVGLPGIKDHCAGGRAGGVAKRPSAYVTGVNYLIEPGASPLQLHSDTLIPHRGPVPLDHRLAAGLAIAGVILVAVIAVVANR